MKLFLKNVFVNEVGLDQSQSSIDVLYQKFFSVN